MDMQVKKRPTGPQREMANDLAEGRNAMGAGITHVSASAYVDPAHFELERERIFDRLPRVIAPSALLPRPKMSVAHDGFGMPLLLTRDRNGVSHIFYNVCRHRGSRIVEDDEVRAGPVVTCPYHAWSFALDGALVGLPRAETFPGLDKCAHGLVELPSVEAGGLIWFARQQADFSTIDGLTAEFDALEVGDHHLYRSARHDVRANWKLIMDAFLEGYHVPRLHSETIGKLLADSVTAVCRIGRHHCSAAGRLDNLPQKDPDLGTLRATMTLAYQIFPHSVLVVSPSHINLLVLMPQSVDRTAVEHFMLLPREADAADPKGYWQRNWALQDEGVFGAEDFRAAAMSQQGLASGAIDHLTFGTLETPLRVFHDEIEAALRD